MLFIRSMQASSGLYVIKNHNVLWQRHMCSQQLIIAALQESHRVKHSDNHQGGLVLPVVGSYECR